MFLFFNYLLVVGEASNCLSIDEALQNYLYTIGSHCPPTFPILASYWLIMSFAHCLQSQSLEREMPVQQNMPTPHRPRAHQTLNNAYY